MVGGAQGSGVDSGANIFARACCYAGLYVFGNREYHSNIKGMHSYFQIRVAERPVYCHRSSVDLLATFDAETLVRHRYEVTKQGGIIYDPAYEPTKIQDIPTLEREFVDESVSRLNEKGFGGTVGDLIDDARKDGILTYPMPYMNLLKEIADKFGESPSKAARVTNVLALGASFAILDSDIGLLAKAVNAIFGAKPKIAEMNVLASRIAYDYTKKNFGTGFGVRLERVEPGESRIFLMGNQAVALGKLAGGCRFQTYYPITPAADESEYLEANERLALSVQGRAQAAETGEASLSKGSGSIVVVQTEDELAAMNMASGAVLTGTRASTSTSGPGFSLMVEGLGWAGMNEVPVVITYYQRGAPATGLPTRHGQDDLRFAIHAAHGEFPRIVLASGDIQECFYDAALAFNYAERFQMPVVHLLDKALANSSNTYPTFNISSIAIERGELLDADSLQRLLQERGEYKRFQITEWGVSPRIRLGTAGTVFWDTGDEHDERGHIDENPTNRTKMMEKRMIKLEAVEKEIPASEKLNFFGQEEDAATVVTWGSPKGAVLEAKERLEADGTKISFLQVRLIHPFPSADFSRLVSRAKKIIDVEMNYSGQLAGIVREKTGIVIDDLILKYNGRPMSSDEVYEAIKNSLTGKGGKRQVLMYGA